MKNFFRKLHIAEGSGDGASSSPPPPPSRKGSGGGAAHHPVPEQRQPPPVVSSWLDSVPTRPPPPTPPTPAEGEGSASASPGGEERRQSGGGDRRRAQQEEGMERRQPQEDEAERRVIRESSEAEERKREREKEEDDLEEFQLQLMLEMSAEDNPEEMEIEVAKQMSLGFCRPASSPAEVIKKTPFSLHSPATNTALHASPASELPSLIPSPRRGHAAATAQQTGRPAVLHGRSIPLEMDDDQERELEALEGLLSDPSAEPIRLSYGLLKFITDNFSHEIGRGGFGVVYQGDLRNGVVAVKRSNGLYITDKQFMDEIKCLKSANHKNIVRFLGYCADTQEEVMPLDGTFVMAGERNRLFCFECVPNGNIRQYLEQEKSRGDDWPARYQMIRGICQGLKYLHDKKINHRDLKPENVMLDADMEAKITDFGLSRFLCQGQSQIITQHICGTLRYIAPEVIDRRELSLGSDIYALGVIIIELLTGTSMISLENWDESLDLLDCPRARMCAELARKCTDRERDNRPTIHEVIHCMDELESMIPVSSTTHQLVTPTAFPWTELLDVYPLELRFLFVPDEGEMSCSLTMINKTDRFVYCLVTPRDSYNLYECVVPPMSSSVGRVYLKSEEEIPSNMVEWEILMFTTQFDNEEVMTEQMESGLSELEEEDRPLEDQIKVLQEFFGGELHRAALTASVIVGSEVLQVHTIDKEEPSCTIDWMDVHPTEPWVLLRAGDTVYIWNWQSNEKVGEYNSPAELCPSYGKPRKDYDDSMAKFIAREQWAVVGDSDGYITVLTCPTMDQVQKFKAHGDGVSSLAVHPTRPFLLSSSLSFSLKLWDWSSDWSCTRIFDVKSRLTQIMFNPKDTTTFATRGQDGFVQMWKIGHLNSVAKTHSRDGRESSHLFTYTGNRDCVASVHQDSHNISIWDLRKEKHVHTLHNPLYGYTLAACHPTLPILVTVSRYSRLSWSRLSWSRLSWSRRIEVWDSATYRLKKAYDNLRRDLIDVGFTGSRLVIGYKKGISVLDIDLE